MAVAAIDPQLAGVMLVTEWNRLIAMQAGSRNIGRPVKSRRDKQKRKRTNEQTKEAYSRDRI
jgi:hypothetical protein